MDPIELFLTSCLFGSLGIAAAVFLALIGAAALGFDGPDAMAWLWRG